MHHMESKINEAASNTEVNRNYWNGSKADLVDRRANCRSMDDTFPCGKRHSRYVPLRSGNTN